MSEYPDERDELCQRFRESLSKPISERFYDEDELVELFDYAGDLGDDYLRMEVLLSGARLYPDSEALRTRRAIFYGTFEGDTQAKFFQDNTGEGPMWDILRLPYSDVAQAELPGEFSKVLEKYDSLDDEEIIQLVGAAEVVQMYDWLQENLAAIEARTSFPQTLYYEMGVVAEQLSRYDKAAEMFERLTDLDPSNAEYWFLLAQNYTRIERNEDALNAIEFALALQPKNVQMRALRASIFIKLKQSMPLALKELEDIRAEFPDDPELLEMFTSANDSLRGEDDTMSRLRDMAETLRPSYGALTLYLMRKASEVHQGGEAEFRAYARRLIDAFYLSNESDGTNTRSNWLAWADFFNDTGFRELAFDVLLSYSANSNDSLNDVPVFFELAVLMHSDELALRIIDANMAGRGEDFYKGKPMITILYLIEMMRHGRFEAVDHFIEHTDISDYGNPYGQTADTLVRRKLLLVLASELKIKLADPKYRDPSLWRDFDPLH